MWKFASWEVIILADLIEKGMHVSLLPLFFFFFFFPPHAVSSLQQGECWATGGRARERASKRIISAPCRKRKPETVWQTCRATETQHLGGEFLHLCETFNGVKCEVAAWKQLGPIHVLNAPLTHSTHVNTPGPPRGSRSPPHSYLRGLLTALLKARFEEKKKSRHQMPKHGRWETFLTR